MFSCRLLEHQTQGRIFGFGSRRNDVLSSLEGSSISPRANLTCHVEELKAELQNSSEENALFKKRLKVLED